jgi:hypothetical protein
VRIFGFLRSKVYAGINATPPPAPLAGDAASRCLAVGIACAAFGQLRCIDLGDSHAY